MAGASLAFDILARDKASRTLSKIGGEVDKTHSHFAKLGSTLGGVAKAGLLVGGAAGLGAVAAVIKTGIGEVSDYQKGFAQLQQGLKTTHGAAGITAGQMEKLASKIQDYSGQTDDSVVATEQLLLTFTNIRNEAGKNNDYNTQTTKIAADMAARMGGDASTQAIRLGKALNDPVKGVSALARVGVSFTEGQKKQIKSMVDSGHTMAAQKVILGELNKEFGGSAKAVGNTLPGMIDKAKRHFEDWSQSLVTKMLPVITSLARFIQSDVIPIVQALVTRGFARLMPVIQAVSEVITKHYLPAVKVAFGFVQANVLPIIRALADFIITKLAPALGKILGAALDGLRSAFQHISKTVAAHREQLQTLGNFLRKVAEIALKVLAPVLGVALKTAFRILGTAISVTITIIAGLVSTIRGIIHVAADVIGFLRAHWKLILSILTGPFGAAAIFIVTHFGAIVGFVKKLPGRIASAASGMWDGIKNSFRSAINWIVDAWNNFSFGMDAVKVAGHTVIPGFHVNTPDIPHLAAGGVVTKPTVALIGEAGPEAVVPLRRGGIGGMHVTIEAGVITRDGAREIDKILRRLNRESGGALGYA